MATHAPITGAPTCAPIFPTDLSHILRACRDHSITPTRFGRRALGDPRLVGDMRRGRELRPETREKVRTFIASLGEAVHG